MITKRFDRVIALMIIIGMIYLTAMVMSQKTFGSGTPGLGVSLATTSTASVGTTTAKLIFASKVFCSSRVISTQGQPIMMSFASTTFLPTAVVGFQQLASTTVVYDSGTYGCGEWWIRGEAFATTNASTTITVAEFR